MPDQNTAMLSTEVECRQCHRPNPQSRRYCGGCGASLWEKCPKCGADGPADEQFCGSCGIDIHKSLSQRIAQIERDLTEAERLTSQHEYEEALALLHGVAGISEARFDAWARRARIEIDRIMQIRTSQQKLADQKLDRARGLVESCNYEAAISQLESIPQSLKLPEADELLAKARAARSELTSLGSEIRQAIENKEVRHLLPKIQRLMALKPDHKQAQELARQVRDSLVKLAAKHVSQHEYAEAVLVLDDIPEPLRTDEARNLLGTAGELAVLSNAVEHAPFADRTTLLLTERLVKIAPSDTAATRLQDELRERAKARPDNPRCPFPVWHPAPQKTRIGPRIDWLANITQTPAASDEVRKQLSAQPGQFFTALGLALQGVGAAAIETNLMPREKKGMLDLLPALSLTRRGPEVAWGLDLSESGLKAIKLSRDKAAELTIDAALFLPHARPLSHPDAVTERAKLTADTLQEFVSKAGELKGCSVSVGMPGSQVLGRFFELPPLALKKVEAAVLLETRLQFPIALEELCHESHIFGSQAKKSDEVPRRVMVVAARQAHAAQRVSLFKSAGISVDFVQSDVLALANAALHELFASAADSQNAIALIDVGSAGTNIVVASPEEVWFRTTGLAGDAISAALVREFKLTWEQAELLKREPARARRFSQMQAVLTPLFAQLAGEIERSLMNCAKHSRQLVASQVSGCGGAFQTYGLLRHLRTGN